MLISGPDKSLTLKLESPPYFAVFVFEVTVEDDFVAAFVRLVFFVVDEGDGVRLGVFTSWAAFATALGLLTTA